MASSAVQFAKPVSSYEPIYGLSRLVRKLAVHRDHRGSLCELFRRDEICETLAELGFPDCVPQMGYISMTEQGQLRGPHEHVRQIDVFIFCASKFTIWLWDLRKGSPTKGQKLKFATSSDEHVQLIVPPGIAHAYRSDQEAGLSINTPTELYRGVGKKEAVDEIRHEDDPESPIQPW